MPAVFDQKYVKRLSGTNVKTGNTKRELAEQLRADIRAFKEQSGCDRLVMVWCASTEVFIRLGAAHQSLTVFEKAMDENDEAIAPSMLYAWASIMEGVPFANGARVHRIGRHNLSQIRIAIRQYASGHIFCLTRTAFSRRIT